jgi:hypothetical protein
MFGKTPVPAPAPARYRTSVMLANGGVTLVHADVRTLHDNGALTFYRIIKGRRIAVADFAPGAWVFATNCLDTENHG